MATLSEVNATLENINREQVDTKGVVESIDNKTSVQIAEQERTTGAVLSVANKISAQMEADEKSRLRDLNQRTSTGSSQTSGGISRTSAAGAGLLGGLLAGLGGGLMKGAAGVAALGLALPAFFGGLLAGDAGLKWLGSIGADFNFSALKAAAIGFTDMIMEMNTEAFVVLAGIMGISAVGGTNAAKGLGTMGFAISAFLGGLLAGDLLFSGVSALGASLDFESMRTMFAGFSNAIGALSQEAVIALAGILGISGLAATFGKGPTEALGIASIMTGIGAGIAGLMIGLSAGNKALTWLDSVAGVGGSGLKNAFGLFNDIIGELNNKESIIALTGIIAAGAALGVATTPAGALAAGAGIMAVMTSIGAGIAGLFIGLAAGGKLVDLIESIPGGDGDGFTSIIRMFNDMILAISPEAIDRMADISKKRIGGGLASLAGGIVAMLGAEGLGGIAEYFRSAKDALLGAVDWIFGTNLGGERKKSTIEQIIEGLEPINNMPVDMISKIDQFSAAISGLASSFIGLQEISVERSTNNLAKMVRDIGGVMEMWPHLTGDNPEPYDPRGYNLFGKDKIDFGGGLKNIKEADIELVYDKISSIRSALEGRGGITGQTESLMQRDYSERTGAGGGSVSSYIDNRQTVNAPSNSTSYMLPMGPAIDQLDPGYATRRR